MDIAMKEQCFHIACLAGAAMLCLFGLTGCVHYQGDGTVGAIIATSEAFKAFDGEYENTPYFKNHKPASIAVLPFSSPEEKLFTLKKGFDKPEDVVRKGLYNHISSLPFKDLELFDIDTRLQNAGIQDGKSIHQLIDEDPKKLKSILGVESVVTGTVSHFDKIFAGIYSQVAVGCEVKMWDLETGNLLWRAKHVSRAHAGGLSLNPIGLLMSAAASAWNLRNTELLSQTDELFREMVSTIELPESMRITPRSKTVIDLFAVMNANKPFTSGKYISFRLIGDADCKAYVDLINYKSAIDLEPLAPSVKQAMKADIMGSIQHRYEESGQKLSPEMMAEVEKEFATREIYEGVYTVSPGEEKYGLTAKAYLVNAFGDQASKLDVVHTIDIDAVPPAEISDLSAESLNRKVHIRWLRNQEADLSGYEIWSSRSPLSGFKAVKTSEKNDAVLDDLANFDPYYIKVRAVDRANNKGSFGKAVKAVALPKQGLLDLPRPGPVLDGSIDGDILLVREKSPYRILSKVKVKGGATLFAEPGVTLRFSPKAALIVDGGSIVAYGRKDQPVRMTPAVFDAVPGSWHGLVLKQSPHTMLHHVVIEKAETGMTITDSSPEILSASISNCSQAGLYLKENARPNMTCSVLSSNHGQGGMVIEGAGIAPSIHNNSFIDNEPFEVQSYTPLNVDLTDNYWGSTIPDNQSFLGHITWNPFLPAPPQTCPVRRYP
jgi:hypothetical protein